MDRPAKLMGWQAGGASVRGASHIRAATPNQDALDWYIRAETSSPAVLAVADGHGSQAYVRSHKGAKFAVQTSIEVMLQFAQRYNQPEHLPNLNRIVAEQLPRTITRRWQDRVFQDLADHPLTKDELDMLTARVRARMVSEPVGTTVYGSTLLATLVTDLFLLFWQLGDGDVLTVTQDERVQRPPIPTDNRLLANQTTSLCMPDSWQNVRTYVQPVMDRPPALIMLATDGYANSFADQSGLANAAADLLSFIRTDGFETTCRRLPTWLRTTSRLGSGDDITVGLLSHTDPVHQPDSAQR